MIGMYNYTYNIRAVVLPNVKMIDRQSGFLVSFDSRFLALGPINHSWDLDQEVEVCNEHQHSHKQTSKDTL